MEKKTAAERIAEALLHTGSSDYVVRSGAILTLMTNFSKEGDLASISDAYLAFTGLSPGDRRAVANAVPAKILNGYLYQYRKRSGGSLLRWQRENEDWANALKSALGDRARFVAIIQTFEEQIARVELS